MVSLWQFNLIKIMDRLALKKVDGELEEEFKKPKSALTSEESIESLLLHYI